MKFSDLEKVNRIANHLAELRRLSAKVAGADMCQFLTAERSERDGEVIYIRNRAFMLAMKKFVDEQIASTIAELEALGVQAAA